jgi:GMP synthase (glutamine-hydrolysing)
MRILAIQNCSVEGFGLYEQYLVGRGIDLTVFRAFREQPLPPHEGFDAFLIGGTPISAYSLQEHPFLGEEYDYLRAAVSAGKPCFGICFGAQILARILGAEVRKAEQREIGVYEVALTRAGQEDPVLNGFPPRFPVFQWHGDTFEIPHGARLLAEGDGCRNQMFRRENVVGVQFHLEVTSSDVAAWSDAYADELAEFGKSGNQVSEECQEHERQMGILADQLLNNFLGAVVTS